MTCLGAIIYTEILSSLKVIQFVGVCVCVCIKNDAKYIGDFVSHYIGQGVDHFYIVNRLRHLNYYPLK